MAASARPNRIHAAVWSTTSPNPMRMLRSPRSTKECVDPWGA